MKERGLAPAMLKNQSGGQRTGNFDQGVDRRVREILRFGNGLVGAVTGEAVNACFQSGITADCFKESLISKLQRVGQGGVSQRKG